MVSDLWQTICAAPAVPAYHYGTYRTTSPAETLRKIEPLLGRAGITRVADVTGLDYLGIPVYQAIRPLSKNISVSQGKGLTRQQAKASALMESLECFHAESIAQPGRRETVGTMCQELDYCPFDLPVTRKLNDSRSWQRDDDLFALPVGQPTLLRNETVIDWIAATDLSNGAVSWVPRQLCELNFCVESSVYPPFFRTTSNGLASGNNVSEALVHGLCEVIERDSAQKNEGAWADPDRCIDPTTIDSRLISRLIEKFAGQGIKTHIVDISGPSGLPSFEVFITDQESQTYKGLGCHPNRATALIRALTEAAQGRLAHISGSREDLYRSTYQLTPSSEPKRRLPETGRPRRRFTDVPTLPVTNLKQLLRDIVQRVRAITGTSPLAVDLRKPEFAVPVTFVVSPGLMPPPGH